MITDLLRTIIISPEKGLAERLETALAEFGDAVKVCRTLNAYPTAIDLRRILRVHAPEAVFLSFENLAEARAAVKLLEVEAEGLQVIAIHSADDHSIPRETILRETMRCGIREFLTEPFERENLAEALTHVKELLDRKAPVYGATDEIFSFLPSKPGVGATTIAVNVSAALSRRPDTSVLLSDFDLNSGMLRFLLKLSNTHSILEALESAPSMDETLWPQLVTAVGGMDVLHAGGINPSLRIEPDQVRYLVQFMRRNYKILCFDLSGNLERYSIEVMRESRCVMLVCTPEIASLHLAKEKLAYLKSVDLLGRVSVLLNRVHRKATLGVPEVEELLGVPVLRSFGNDYAAVSNAISEARPVDPGSAIGKQFEEFAQSLIKQPSLVHDKKHKFLEMFRVSKTVPAGS
jgi:pilus assembly protein CpaE